MEIRYFLPSSCRTHRMLATMILTAFTVTKSKRNILGWNMGISGYTARPVSYMLHGHF